MPVFFEVGWCCSCPSWQRQRDAADDRPFSSACLSSPDYRLSTARFHRTPQPCSQPRNTTPTSAAPSSGIARRASRGRIGRPRAGWLLTRRWLKRTAGANRQIPSRKHQSSAVRRKLRDRLCPCDPSHREVEPVPPPAGPIRAATAILLPIGLIFLGSWADSIAAPGTGANQIFRFIGSPDVALLIAVLAALVTSRAAASRQAAITVANFATGVHGVLRAHRQCAGDSRRSRRPQRNPARFGRCAGHHRHRLDAHMPPLVLAWTLAAVVRVAMGSATVAMAVAAGVLAPMVDHLGVRPELLVLATGTGSLDSLARQRSRLLDDSVVFQIGDQGNTKHLDGNGDRPLDRRIGRHPAAGSNSSLAARNCIRSMLGSSPGVPHP